jgi:hypothetical protein
MRVRESKTHGNQVLKELVQLVDVGGRKAIDAEGMTLDEGTATEPLHPVENAVMVEATQSVN